MKTIAIIPARMGSSRCPGKPLAPIHGIAMIGHVYFRARLSRRLDAVFIATCDAVIERYAAEIGAPCIMTSPSHARASDRSAEAAQIIDARAATPADPLIGGRLAGAAVDVFEHEPLPRDSRLRSLANCWLAPHNANSSVVAAERVHERTLKSRSRALRKACD